MKLRYIYVGSKDLKTEIKFQIDFLGAKLNWWFDKFGAQVASLNVGHGPELLLATHLEPGQIIWIYEVGDIERAKAELPQLGAVFKGELEIPNGPCLRFDSGSGREFAIFEDTRPGAMEKAYEDPKNESRVFL